MKQYASVLKFLEAHARGRPQTFEEICAGVEKARSGCWREVNTLLLYGEVKVIVLRFNNRECPFYTLRSDVEIGVVRGPVLVEVRAAQTIIVVDAVDDAVFKNER